MTFQMLTIIFAGVLGGHLLDKWIRPSFPVFTLILSFLGVLLAIYYFIKDLIRFKK